MADKEEFLFLHGHDSLLLLVLSIIAWYFHGWNANKALC